METSEKVYIPHRSAGWYLFLPVPFFESGDGGKADEMPFDGRRQVSQERQQFFADPIAKEPRVVVRGVLPPGKSLTAKVFAHRLPRYSEQRPNQARLRSGQDAAETGWSRTAEQAEQNGLGLVGGGMPGSDPVDDTGGAPLAEEPEPGSTAGLFQVSLHHSTLRHIAGEIAGQATDELLVGVGGGSAEAMIHMKDNQRAIVQRSQSVEEKYAVRASRDGYAELDAGNAQPVQRRCDLVEHLSR